MAASPPLCWVQDYFHDTDTPEAEARANGPQPINSTDELARFLRRLTELEPRVAEVELPDGMAISLAVGGPLAALYVYLDVKPPPAQNRTWYPLANRTYSTEKGEFICVGLHQFYDAGTLMPPDEVIEIVCHLVTHHKFPDTHRWVDSHGVPFRDEDMPARQRTDPLEGLRF